MTDNKTEIFDENAVLVGLITMSQNEKKAKEYLDELAFLAETAGAYPQKKFLQKLDYPNSNTFVGPGKLEEIKNYIKDREEDEEEKIGLVIFDDELSAKQLRNIEKELEIKVLDRTNLILDIFAKIAILKARNGNCFSSRAHEHTRQNHHFPLKTNRLACNRPIFGHHSVFHAILLRICGRSLFSTELAGSRLEPVDRL